MKKILLTLACTAMHVYFVLAQAPEAISIMDELRMESWPGDKQAEAGVLYDKGIVKFLQDNDYGFEIHFSRTTKVKIINDAGIKYGTIEVPLYISSSGGQETVENIKAIVYNKENEQVKITLFDPKQVYEEKINNNWKVKKFALPNVKAGSVIEYSYIVVTPFKFNLRDWEFQWDIPVKLSKFTVSIVPFYEYVFLFQGATKFNRQTSTAGNNEQQFGPATYKEMVYDYELHDVQAFRDEDFITSRKDYIKKIDFQLANVTDVYGTKTKVMTTWKDLTKDMMTDDDFGKYIAAARRECKQTAMFDPKLDTLSNFKEAIDQVKNQFNWDKRYQIVATKSMKNFLAQKTGSSAEINLYAIGMLNAMGINAKPVLISTRNHGKITSDYPFINAFNHVLIMASINGKYYLADATDPYYPFNILPNECINEKGYVVDPKSSEPWLALNNSKISDIGYYIEMNYDPENDEMKAFIRATASNHDAVKLRKKYVSDQDQFKKSLLNGMEADKLAIENLEDNNKRFIVSTNLSLAAEKNGKLLFINPFLDLCEQKNIFKSETRDYQIDLIYNYRRIYTSTITIPQGYKIVSLPSPVQIDDPLMQISLSTIQTDDKISINSTYLFTRSVYQAEDYIKLKKLFNSIVTKFNQQVVLEETD
ncbi:MAG: DUF3857 domain-containing protein [Breznakibacter sp.]